MYFNYHGKIKHLIKEGHLIDYQVMERWNSITPALVLYFDNHKPMPIRKHRWEKYWDLLDEAMNEKYN